MTRSASLVVLILGLGGCPSPRDSSSQGGTDASGGVDSSTIHNDARVADAVNVINDSSVVGDASVVTTGNSVTVNGTPAIIFTAHQADGTLFALSTFPLNPGNYSCGAFGVAMQLGKGTVPYFYNSGVAGSFCSIHVTQVDLDGGPYVGTFTATLKAADGSQAVLTSGMFSGTYNP